MQNISKINKNNKEILKKIKENISELSNHNGINEDEFKEIKTDIIKIHNELNKFENENKLKAFRIEEELDNNNSGSNNDLKEIQKDEIEQREIKIMKKITIKKTKKSKSFGGWLFNNNEL